MLRIRLSRVGKKRQPHFRVVVADIEAKRDGRIVERIGHYTPLTDPISFKIDEGRALYWLSVGAQPSDAVRRLLDKQGTTDRLARFRAGETMEDLVAEYEGVATATVADEVAATIGETAEAVVDAVETAADSAVGATAGAVAEALDLVADEEE
jgi:small subunit ribosomal protein S16